MTYKILIGRAEGTPCTDDSFSEWAKKFSIEMKEEAERLAAETAVDPKKKGGKGAEKVVDKSGRLTGHQQFTDKGGNFNLEAMEAAAENAERDENEVEDVDEDLFLEDDDLDDLDFDDDDDDDDDDDEPDI